MECSYYTQARLRAVERLLELGGDPMVEYESADVMHNLRLALVQLARARMEDLGGAEAAEAIGNLADSLRTRGKGLIYEFRSSNPRAQMVTDALSGVLEMHSKGQKGLRPAPPDEQERCVRQLKRQADGASRREAPFLEMCGSAVGREFIGAAPDGKPDASAGRLTG